MSDVFRKAYNQDPERIQLLLSDELDWKTFSKKVPRNNLGFTCDNPGCGSQEPKLRCTSCLTSWYCSPACQKKHWKDHKMKCQVYKQGRLDSHCPSIYDEGQYHYNVGPTNDTLDWNNQENPINEECYICMDKKFDPKRSIVLPCRHQFCAGCIIEWQKGNLGRGSDKQSDQCVLCFQKMPVVEQNLMERADKLLQQAKEEKKKVHAPAEESGEGNDIDDGNTHQRLCEEALELTEKALQSKNCQRTNHITKAEILTEMGRNDEAVQAIDDLLRFHYSITQDPLVQNCLRYEQAVQKKNQERMNELMETMKQQAQRKHRGNIAPFIMVNDAYTIQARAMMAAKAWDDVIYTTQLKLFDFTFQLMAGTPWIAGHRDFQAKIAKRNIEYMLNLGVSFYNLGEYTRALRPLSFAAMMNQQSKIAFDSYKYLALSFKELGDWEEVLKVISTAALYQPHCEPLGRETHLLYKEMLKDYYDNHQNDETPDYESAGIDILQIRKS